MPRLLDARLARLATMEGQIEDACGCFARLRTPRNLRIRPEFARWSSSADPNGEPGARLLPPRNERPPATRLVSPRGVALRLYLTALFTQQSRPPGTKPGNSRPLAGSDEQVGWTDLIASTAESRRYATRGEKKLRQLHDALRRLASPEVQLVRLPNFERGPTGRYEGFQLMREGGVPREGGDNERYTVPAAETRTMYLPGGLFTSGWIHVLEDSELAFLLMLACLRSRSDKPAVFATSKERLLDFGLGRDAYEAHRILAGLGLIRVHAGPHPGHRRGKAGKFVLSDPPKLHRFELLNDGFAEPAVPAARRALAEPGYEAGPSPVPG